MSGGIFSYFDTYSAAEHLIHTMTVGEAEIKIFCAKPLGRLPWHSVALRHLVGQARAQYACYGDVALFDEHDERAAVYVAIARYPVIIGGTPQSFEEIISVRFVPGYGERSVLEDFELFQMNGIPLIEYLKTGSSEVRPILNYLVSISRFCASQPLFFSSKNTNAQVAMAKRRCTALAFMLMNQAFFAAEGERFEYVSAVLRNELAAKLARGSLVEELWPRSLPLTDVFLACSPCDISLRRTRQVAYRFPGYFLHIHQLRALLLELLETDRLSVQSIHALVPELRHVLVLSEIVTSLTSRQFGILLTHEGELPHSALTGDYVRALVDMRVADGPRLHLGHRNSWEKLLQKSVQAFSRCSHLPKPLEKEKFAFPRITYGYAPTFAL